MPRLVAQFMPPSGSSWEPRITQKRRVAWRL